MPIERQLMKTEAKQEKRIYFKGLNGLRFVAATAVIFHHIEQYKYWKGLDSLWGQAGWVGVFIDGIGHKAVSFFFVLSGFLISYLLYAEINKTQTVNLPKFYMRRILRIWPLYYLIAIFALFVMPHIVYFEKWHELMYGEFAFTILAYLLILPNLVRVSAVQVPGANQAWSVGVEEQFYLIWPFLIRLFKNNILLFLCSFIALKMATQALLLSLANHATISKILTLLQHLQIEQMAIGAIGAYFLYLKKNKLLKLIYHPVTQVLSFGLFASFFMIDYHFFGTTLLEALVFVFIIMNISTNPKFPISFERPWMATLGNISYGIYMYHTVCISLLLGLIFKLNFQTSSLAMNLILYIGSPIITFIISYLSYTYFETFFLNLKDRFTVIKSNKK